MGSINFFFEQVSRPKHFRVRFYRQWLGLVAQQQQLEIVSLNYIFCHDNYLLAINQQYLQHDYYTDVITFDHSHTERQIEADIFISLERVKDNAQQFKIPYNDELDRVMVHGLLHLAGYDDKTPSAAKHMRYIEDICLALRVPRGTQDK